MSQTLLTGASGLLSHQRKLDVVANNLANLNTTGYKSQRILFSDLLYTTIQPAASGSSGDFGGTNPRQAGFGVAVAQTGRNQGQGVLTATGSSFDFAIQGEGFFVLDDGTTNYSRAGAFSLDSNGYLVDPASGAFVQRHGSLGEGVDGFPQFQVPGNNAIQVPLGAGIAGRITSEASFAGNLPATAIPPLAEVIVSVSPFLSGGIAATGTTLLDDLDSNVTNYTAGDVLRIEGTNVDGSDILSTLAVDGTTTLQDVVDEFNNVLTGASAALGADGNITITADEQGATNLAIEVFDDPANTGQTGFANNKLVTTVEGKAGDIVESTIEIFDLRGEPHFVGVEFQKQDNNSWDATFVLESENGELTDGVFRIEFSEDGQLSNVQGAGGGETRNMLLNFDSITEQQEIALSFDQLSHLATNYSSSFEQNGFPPGNLVSVNVTQQGVLEGTATNGQRVPIAQLAIASFINVQGLSAKGQNFFDATSNSGLAQIGPGLTGANGVVRGGQLESSNVDVALEFTQLIVAQRGFSANARTITVASEVLEELANIVR
jgi:flagellar hook protein FlgE